jgi:hypothetical protein
MIRLARLTLAVDLLAFNAAAGLEDEDFGARV